MKKAAVVRAFSPEAVLKRKVRDHLRKLGFRRSPDGALLPPSSSKENIRAVHLEQRKAGLKEQREFVRRALPKLQHHFADGSEVAPEKVEPQLELIKANTWQSDLFRLASLSWSVPVSAGYGRRLRYLVWDKSNRKLIGIMALGDPVFNLKARDVLIGWNVDGRTKRLVHMLDAYVLGAVPPYNFLLAGKLISCLLRSREIRDDFAERYGKKRGVISRRRKAARLVAVTTSSSLGRSSVYNRLKLDHQPYLTSIGYTQGWGHFHVPDTLFAELRAYLRKRKHKYVDGHRFGQGPNWRLRTIRAAFDALGFRSDLLRHGIGRELFVCELALNAKQFLLGQALRPNYRGIKTVAEIGDLARARWLLPRAQRRPEFKEWTREQLRDLILSPRQQLEATAHSSLRSGGASRARA